MTPERAASFKQQRDEVAAQAQLMQAVPQEERPTKASALKAWLAQLHHLETLVTQMDAILAKNTPRTPRGKQVVPAVLTGEQEAVVLARIPKGKRAEMRVSVKPWLNRRVVDIRIWSLPKEGGEMKPSRKGITFDASKLDVLLDALHQAKQHV